jgi:hypothetical protein
VLIGARFVPVLRDHFGRHCHTDSQLGDGRARVRIAAPTPLDIARNLAEWGVMIEVIEPRIVQARLARIGQLEILAAAVRERLSYTSRRRISQLAATSSSAVHRQSTPKPCHGESRSLAS